VRKNERLPVFSESEYHQAARDYQRRSSGEPLGDEMAQARQREITICSLALIHLARPEMTYYNDLMIRYPGKRLTATREVVPDNFVVLHPSALHIADAFDLSAQQCSPFWVLDYVSPTAIRKDYDQNRDCYEKDLAVPYYLRFETDTQTLVLHHLVRHRYVRVRPNTGDRHAINELDVEVAIQDGWVRFWFRGKLVPLPAELSRQVDALKDRCQKVEARVHAAEQELKHLRALLERQR